MTDKKDRGGNMQEEEKRKGPGEGSGVEGKGEPGSRAAGPASERGHELSRLRPRDG